MIINLIKTKNIITKSNLPDADFVINPYTGCSHACIYCYARFMKRFTGHTENWGDFVDVKLNAVETIPSKKKFKNKSIFMSSVTDPYLPIEKRYKLTRSILSKIIPMKPNLSIQTKSALITRDIDLFTQFNSCKAGLTITTVDDDIRKQIEPGTSSVEKRIAALKQLKKSGVYTYVFIGPILPYITDWKQIVNATKNYTDEYMFENLNMHGTISKDIYNWLGIHHKNLVDGYKDTQARKTLFWDTMSSEIEDYAIQNNLKFKLYFHHKKK